MTIDYRQPATYDNITNPNLAHTGSIFNSIITDALDLLQKHQFHHEPIKQDFNSKKGLSEYTLVSYALSRHFQTLVRCSKIFGARAEMLNIMIYPSNPVEVPVFASEFVFFGGKIVIAIIDMQPVVKDDHLRNKIHNILKPYYDQYAHLLSPGGQFPEWAAEYFTRYCIYSRPQRTDEIDILIKAHYAYLELWCEEFLPYEQNNGKIHPSLFEYQIHHVVNIPSRPFLSKIFGEDWTDIYLTEFLYPLSLNVLP